MWVAASDAPPPRFAILAGRRTEDGASARLCDVSRFPFVPSTPFTPCRIRALPLASPPDFFLSPPLHDPRPHRGRVKEETPSPALASLRLFFSPLFLLFFRETQLEAPHSLFRCEPRQPRRRCPRPTSRETSTPVPSSSVLNLPLPLPVPSSRLWFFFVSPFFPLSSLFTHASLALSFVFFFHPVAFPAGVCGGLRGPALFFPSPPSTPGRASLAPLPRT